MLLAATALMVSHVRAWRRYRSQELADEELEYRRRQFRRRMQTSAMLGILAIAIVVGELVTVRIGSSWFRLIYYCGILLVVFVWQQSDDMGGAAYMHGIDRATESNNFLPFSSPISSTGETKKRSTIVRCLPSGWRWA